MICKREAHGERMCNLLRYIPNKLNLILKETRSIDCKRDYNFTRKYRIRYSSFVSI